jgi:hypothetical protein
MRLVCGRVLETGGSYTGSSGDFLMAVTYQNAEVKARQSAAQAPPRSTIARERPADRPDGLDGTGP